MTKAEAFGAVLLMIVMVVYGQLVLKWQAGQITLPEDWGAKIVEILRLVLNPWVASGLFAAFIGALAWMAALTRLDLSQAYPFTALTIVIVVIAGAFVFNESFSWNRGIGVFLIVGGLVVMSRG